MRISDWSSDVCSSDLLGRITHADIARRQIDLHRARLTVLRQELGVWECRADHQKRVAAIHHPVARLGAEQADRAGDVRQVVRYRSLAEQRFGDTRAEQLADLDHLIGRSEEQPSELQSLMRT